MFCMVPSARHSGFVFGVPWDSGTSTFSGGQMRRATSSLAALVLSAVVVVAISAGVGGRCGTRTKVADVSTRHASEAVEQGTLPLEKVRNRLRVQDVRHVGGDRGSGRHAAGRNGAPDAGARRLHRPVPVPRLHAARDWRAHRGLGAEGQPAGFPGRQCREPRLPRRRLPQRRRSQRDHRRAGRLPDPPVRQQHLPEGVGDVQRAADRATARTLRCPDCSAARSRTTTTWATATRS